MHKHMILTIAVVILVSCSAGEQTAKHEFEIVSLKKYYDGKGAIVPDTSKSYFVGRAVKKRITPSVEEVESAERILNDQISDRYKKDLDNGKIYFREADSVRTKEDSLKKLAQMVRRVEKDIRTYYRQYVAYINTEDEEIIVISLFNYSTKEAREHFENWQDEYYLGSGDFYDNNALRFVVNVSSGKIE